jgi:transposase-like protein
MERVEAESKKARKPGRPRAIPVEMERAVVELYREGYGYRAIARILRKEHGLNPHYSSVRKTLIRLGEVRRQ